MLKRIYILFLKKYKKYRYCSGFTLVEVLIAIFLIGLLSVGLIQGTMVALNAVTLNKEKTKAIAIANEKIEVIKAMEYENIGLTSENPGWEIAYPELSEAGYSIYYYSTWVGDEVDSYKQVMITVINSKLNVPVEVITRLYPTLGNAPDPEPGYPVPQDLVVDYDTGYGINREIKLIWIAPETVRGINSYNVYKDDESIGIAFTEIYIDNPGDDSEHTFYITAVYNDSTESDPSNSVIASREPQYSSPQNMIIESYEGSGSSREVLVSWDEPVSPFVLIEYRIYRDGALIDNTVAESYQDLIGADNYTYYVTAYYEGDNESDPSNEITTE